METPFSKIIENLQNKTWSRFYNSKENINEIFPFCLRQLKFLNAIYISMCEFDMKSMTSKKDYENMWIKSDKSVLDYFLYITILNQFGRVLDKKFSITIPKFNRIKFFRDKVVEHWDDYSLYAHSGSTQVFGKPAVPYIGSTFKPEDRKVIKKKIDQILFRLNTYLELENPEVSNVMSVLGNSEKTFAMLEEIDLTLSKKNGLHDYKIPKDLVKLLFQFGFPLPIDDIEVYSNDLVLELEKQINF